MNRGRLHEDIGFNVATRFQNYSGYGTLFGLIIFSLFYCDVAANVFLPFLEAIFLNSNAWLFFKKFD